MTFKAADQIVLITHAQGIVAVGTLHFLDRKSLTERRLALAASVDLGETSDNSCRCERVLHGTQLVITPALDSFMASAAKIEELYMGAIEKLVDSGLAMLLWGMSAKMRDCLDSQTVGGGNECKSDQAAQRHKIRLGSFGSQRTGRSSCEVMPAGFERLWERRSGAWSRIVGIDGVAHL